MNGADDDARGRFYATVTGLSAEAGDDGQPGRGNRVNGLITPRRAMTLESVAGKNPVTHVGKLYNVAAVPARRGAGGASCPGLAEAECRLVSRIGRRVDDPPLAARARARRRPPRARRCAPGSKSIVAAARRRDPVALAPAARGRDRARSLAAARRARA